ncbi:MAG: hypothetical protein ACXAD7_16455 [Candidatus Kariarchaeaceae archaeon]
MTKVKAEYFTFRIDSHVKRKIEKEAQNNNISASKYARTIVENYINGTFDAQIDELQQQEKLVVAAAHILSIETGNYFFDMIDYFKETSAKATEFETFNELISTGRKLDRETRENIFIKVIEKIQKDKDISDKASIALISIFLTFISHVTQTDVFEPTPLIRIFIELLRNNTKKI